MKGETTMKVIAQSSTFSIELADWGTLTAKIDSAWLVNGLRSQSPNASLSVDVRIPLNEVPSTLDTASHQVAFTLGSAAFAPEQMDIMPFEDSLLKMERPVPSRIFIEVSDGDDEEMATILIPNEHQRLGRIVVFVSNQRTTKNAEARAYAAVGPLLSQLSTQYRVPLHTVLVERFLVEKPTTLLYGRTVIVPYRVTEMNLRDLNPQQKLLGFHPYERAINHYREGMVSVSPLHKFLSWFKAIEAVQILRQELLLRNPSLKFKPTFVSDTPEIRFKFADLIGQRHTKIIDKHLRKPYRDSVAHWGDGDRPDLSHDHRYGLIIYNLLCHLAEDVFHGLLHATVEAISGSDRI